jgi:hypothetical protein
MRARSIPRALLRASAAGRKQRQTEGRHPWSSPLSSPPLKRGGYVAYNPETGTPSEGESIDEALANRKEATSLYLEEFPTGVSGH